MKTVASIALSLLLIPIAFGQKFDHTVSFRDIKSDNYFRLNYENDVFTSSDYDYTQGLNLELVLPSLVKNPLNHIFILPKNSERRYGLAIEFLGFTADSLQSYSIEYKDRPFAGVLMLKSFSIATDTIRKSRISSSLSLGIIGPGAGAGNAQRYLHKIIGSVIPNGWYYQIKNDVVINYDVNYEKQFVRLGNVFSLQGTAGVKLGTLFTNASLGLNANIGLINSPFTSTKNSRKFQMYAFVQPLVNVIGYDATLQGGLFNDKSVYTIADSEIERFTGQNNFGIVIQSGRFYLEYTQTMLTREVKTFKPHDWGGIRIGYQF